jgi:16S rRNA (cytosine1402-N4)-methyltransferase
MTDNVPDNIHLTVLKRETVEVLDIRDAGIYVDATLGLGGHAEALLQTNETIRLVGIDQDEAALKLAKKRLERFGSRVTLVNSNFSELRSILEDLEIEQVAGIVADLGVSSLQIDSEERGFSFRFDAPLDMRMNPAANTPTAAELLDQLSETEIADIIYRYGEERSSRRIARRIVERREGGTPVRTTKELAELVARSVKRNPKDKIHPATRTFQALRIAVNQELEILEQFLTDGIDSLKIDGRFAVITFHSLEDRIVKQTFQRLAGKCFCPPRMPKCICGAVKKIEIVTRKPVTPGDDEVEKNPRSRSAKLRVIRRIASQEAP